MELNGINIHWLGHAGFLLQAGKKNIYIDPYKISNTSPNADMIFVTHEHYDHLSVEDIDQIVTDDTIVVCPVSCWEKLEYLNSEPIGMKRGQTKEFGEIEVQAIASYNNNKPYHPKDTDWLGFIIDVDGTKIYHTGDADHIPEMKGLQADIILIPVSGTYVMNAKEASEAIKDMDIKHAIPMHYGTIVGDETDAQEFKKLSKIPVTILEKTVF